MGSHDVARRLIVGGIAVAALLLVALVGFLVLSYTPAFTIGSVEADPTEHMDSATIVRLANVRQGSTLLNFDESGIRSALRRNPWVQDVSFVREFPGTLRLVVTERKVDCIVVMSAGNVAWCMGGDGSWIEPLPLSVAEGQSANEVALAKAQEMGALLITDVPASVSPVAGSASTDDTILAVMSYRKTFSDALSSQVVSYKADAVESISCVLKSGVEISLGSPRDIENKESVINSILQKYEGRLTYINVRVYSSPSYRMVDSDKVQAGSGTAGVDYASTTSSSGGSQATTSQQGSGSDQSEATGQAVTDGTSDGTGQDGSSADGSGDGRDSGSQSADATSESGSQVGE